MQMGLRMCRIVFAGFIGSKKVENGVFCCSSLARGHDKILKRGLISTKNTSKKQKNASKSKKSMFVYREGGPIKSPINEKRALFTYKHAFVIIIVKPNKQTLWAPLCRRACIVYNRGGYAPLRWDCYHRNHDPRPWFTLTPKVCTRWMLHRENRSATDFREGFLIHGLVIFAPVLTCHVLLATPCKIWSKFRCESILLTVILLLKKVYKELLKDT